METTNHHYPKLDLGNFYAVELLHTIYQEIDPPQARINFLEKELKAKRRLSLKFPYYYQASRIHKKAKLHVLVVSSDLVEQNTLEAFLTSSKHHVYQAYDKDSLFDILRSRKRFDVVIVSEQFKQIGFGFFPTYFGLGLTKRLPRMIQLGAQEKLSAYDALLPQAFMQQDLENILL
jgi:hypothetical protein